MSDSIQKDHYNQNVCEASSSLNCVKSEGKNILWKDLFELGSGKENYKNKEISLENKKQSNTEKNF